MSKLNYKNIENNKDLYSAGSSGSADAAPRMTESGRSMVEMLGVLAVMGVLSVAGIAGYNSAMNKHRANELLNEASKRATVVAMQMASGRGANIDEFNVHGTQAFTVSGNAGDTTFTLSVTNVDEAVCRQVVNSAGTTGMIRKITSGGTDTAGDASKCTSGALVLTYNADLSNKDIPSAVADEEAAECSGHGYKDSNDDCVCDPGYSGTDCATAACTTGTYCGSGATKECCAADEVCTTSGDVAGTCVAKGGDIACSTNASCNDATKYCKLENLNTDCDAPNKGTCTPLDDGRETTYENGTDKKTFLVSSDNMSWWAADNWCKAHNKKLVTYNTVNSLFGCDKDNESCTWSKFTTDSYWSNGTLPDYWTAESRGDDCFAWGVGADLSGTFGDSACNRSYDCYYALCE